MGSLVKCEGCSLRCDARPIGVYWRWMRADAVWRSYYARVCTACWMSKVSVLDRDYPADEPQTCPGCGVKTEDDYDAIYTTSFPGKGPQVDTESPFCGACAASYRVWVTDHARDTGSPDGASKPRQESSSESPSAMTLLRDLGRSTNVR